MNPFHAIGTTRAGLFGLLLSLLCIAAHAQEGQPGNPLKQKVDLNLTNVSLKEVLEELQHAHQIQLSYADNLLPENKIAKVKARNETVEQVLNRLLTDTGITYKLIGKRVVLVRKAKRTAGGNRMTLRGYLTDKFSGERLIGATVYDPATLQGTTSNIYGFYSITLPAAPSNLVFSYVGYKPQTIPIDLLPDSVLNVSLDPAVELTEVEIVASRDEAIQNRSTMSTIDMQSVEINKIPVLLGERDVLKGLQFMPGVQAGPEGSSGLYVRGGSADQNLVLLDGVPVYHSSHLAGLFSVFNPDAIQKVRLIKGGFPPQYGGRLSSVVDIRMKEGNMNRFAATGTIGLVTSKLTVEGPIKKGKTSFLVSARRTYLDLILAPLINYASAGDRQRIRQGLNFHDINAKINHKFSDKSRLYLSYYSGADKLRYHLESVSVLRNDVEQERTEELDMGFGNRIAALRWNKVMGKKLFSNTTVTYSNFKFNLFNEIERPQADASGTIFQERSIYDYQSGIYDVAARIDFDYRPSPKHTLRFGGGDIYHYFRPGLTVTNNASGASSIDSTFGTDPTTSHELSVYVEDEFRATDRLTLHGGANLTVFELPNTRYVSFQPRINLNYLLHENWSVKASYVKMAQFLHVLSTVSIGLPTDVWVPVTDRVKPQYSDQVAAGFAHTWKDMVEVSVEGYYKSMQNLIEYQDGSDLLRSATAWEDNVEVGKGWSYGVELLVRKKLGKTTGWLGYTWSKTERQFDAINQGRRFPFKFDRRHDLKIAIQHEFSKKVNVSANWLYASGSYITLPTIRYGGIVSGSGGGTTDISGVEHFPNRNNFRIRPFHRLDLSANFVKKKKKFERTWSVGLYNAYGRTNPFYHYFDTNGNGERQLRQVSLFPTIPFVSWSFKI